MRYKNNWLDFTSGFHKICFKFSFTSYDDDRFRIVLSLGYGILFLYLPFHSKIKDECDFPEYGFYFYGEDSQWFDSFWLCLGNKTFCFRMFWDWTWFRTSMLRKDGTWEHETKKDRKDFWKDEWKDVLFSETHEYKYITENGKLQERLATIKVVEREWRWRSFMWLRFPRKIIRDIEIEFNKEIGERVGSYKGGTIGCSYEMKKVETPYNTLKRMEMTRNFK